jgi:hypothetical protein
MQTTNMMGITQILHQQAFDDHVPVWRTKELAFLFTPVSIKTGRWSIGADLAAESGYLGGPLKAGRE